MAAPSATDQIFQISSSNPRQRSFKLSHDFGRQHHRRNLYQHCRGSTQTLATISVSGGGVTRSATLTLNPAVAPQTCSLAVTAGGRSGERVISNPAGLSVATGSTGSTQVAPGSAVTLSVASGRDAIWGGACSSGGAKAKTCKMTVNANSSVTANVQ